MQRTVIVYFGEGLQDEAKKIVEAIREHKPGKVRDVARMIDATRFDGSRENCTDVFVVPGTKDFHRKKIEEAYGKDMILTDEGDLYAAIPAETVIHGAKEKPEEVSGAARPAANLESNVVEEEETPQQDLRRTE